jgi:4-hydroxy-2-oxoheptanedioate aldolase
MASSAEFVKKLKSHEIVFGSWVQIPHPIVAEVMALGGMDFLVVDGEHGPIPASMLIDILPGTDKHGTAVIYRVPWNRPEYFKAALDAGARGLMVPMVNSPAEAAEAVSFAKYPPTGTRGSGAWRASTYYRDDAAYRATANADTVLILQIETGEAVDAVDAIAATPGIDALFIGTGDLALSLGIEPGKPHPKLMAACEAVAAAAKKYGIVAGIVAGSPDNLPQYLEMGFRLFMHGVDIDHLLQAGRRTSQSLREKAATVKLPPNG